jgi:DNA repair protein RecN (Recombination protein N)
MLSNAQSIMAALEAGHAFLTQEEDGALAKAGAAARQLDHIQTLHADYADAYSRLQDAYYAMEDVAFTLRDLKNGFEFQPELLNSVENRLERIHMLKRKYGGTIKEILDFLENAQNEYGNLQQSDARREKLSRALAECAARYAVAAENLMRARQSAAKRLSKQLVAQLSDLGMEKSTFEVSLQPLPPGKLTADGLERGNSCFPQTRASL